MGALVSTEMADNLQYSWYLMQSSESEGSGHLNICLILMNYIMSLVPGSLEFNEVVGVKR